MERLSGSSWKLTVRCAGCGAELAVEPDRRFVDCEFCHATSTVDLGGVATCFRLRSALDQESRVAAVLAWLRDQGLQEGAVLADEAGQRQLIPFWAIQTAEGERSLLAVDLTDLLLPQGSGRPPGQLEHLDLEEILSSGVEVVEPSVPLPAAFARVQAEPGRQASLVYAPFSRFSVAFGSSTFQVLLDEASGAVHAMSWPRPRNPRLDRRLGALLSLALAIYTGVALALPGALLPIMASVALSLPLLWMLRRTIESTRVPS